MVRRCFTSFWRLTPGESTLTEGRFYFVPDATPTYPGLHCLDSRDWTDKEREGSTVGEWDGPRIDDKGEPPAVIALPVIVGTKPCIARGGASASAPLTSDPLKLGRYLPAACYSALTGDVCERIRRTPDLGKIVKMVQYAYVNSGGLYPMMENFVGPGAAITVYSVPLDSLAPTSYVFKKGDEAWQIISGTQNEMQALTQAYSFAAGPTNYQTYSASPFYEQIAMTMLDRFAQSGCQDCKRWIVAGHSFGGAVASVLAAKLRDLPQTEQVALVTIGAPRAGGELLIESLRRVCQIHIRHPKDPVPFLPFQEDNWLGVTGYLLFIRQLLFGLYEDYERVLHIDENGTSTTPYEEPPDTDLLALMKLLVGEPTSPPVLDNHASATYTANVFNFLGIPDPWPN